MPSGVEVFDTTLQKTLNLLHDVCSEIGWPKDRKKQAYSALRAVLHVLRDRLPVTESANFAAQLTMLVRGFYYEGWKPEIVPKKMRRDDFLAAVADQFPYAVDGGTQRLVDGVVRALSRHVEASAIEDIKEELPEDIVELLPRAA